MPNVNNFTMATPNPAMEIRPNTVHGTLVALQNSINRSSQLSSGGLFGAMPRRNKGAFVQSRSPSKDRPASQSGHARRSVQEIKQDMDNFMEEARGGGGRTSVLESYHRDRLVLSTPPVGGKHAVSQSAEYSGEETFEHFSGTFPAGGRDKKADVMPLQLADLSQQQAQPRPHTAVEFMMSHQFDHVLPSSSARKALRTPQVLWQQRKFLPAGVKHSNLVANEAARVFGEGPDFRKEIATPGKFVEANSFELLLAELQMQADKMLDHPPANEAKTRYNVFVTRAIFSLINDLADAIGPFGSALRNIGKKLHPFCFSEQRQTINFPDYGGSIFVEEQGLMPWIEIVEMQRRESDRMAATLTSANTLTTQAAKDVSKFQVLNKQLETRIGTLSEQLEEANAKAEQIESKHKKLLHDHEELQKRFHQLQRGFLLGTLQDEVKEMLMEGFGATVDDGSKEMIDAMMEEQSAMQKLVQQLKDAREGMLHARDDMNYWKSKFDGLEDRMRNLRESFQDAKNSLDLQKEKMLGMVPSVVHATLKERYAKLLIELGKATTANQRMKKRLAPAVSTRERAPDDWRNYANNMEDNSDQVAAMRLQAQQQLEDEKLAGGGEGGGGGGWLDKSGKGGGGMGGGEMGDDDEYSDSAGDEDLDEEDRGVPKEFIDSVATQRDKLLASYRNFRRMNGMNVVSWMSLKNMTLAEFARLEQDCFVRNSIWALALKKPKVRGISSAPSDVLDMDDSPMANHRPVRQSSSGSLQLQQRR